VAFNIMRADGSYIGHATVEGKANESGIYLRSGGE
jgi:molybdenum cofactor sulfurtransferase